VTSDSEPKLYRVIGKFSNLTDITNSVGGALKGFRFETGFGVGNEFTPSSAEDGLSFGFRTDIDGKLSIGPVGKYPGGLFGGSKVEGLPFFSTSIADFTESTGTVLDEDRLETDGVIPAEYSSISWGDWLTLANVPTGWFIDHDGNPANDSILLAYNAGTVEAPIWQTFEKTFNSVVVEAITTGGETVTAPATVYDPNGDSFGVYTVTDTTTDPATVTTYTIDVSNVQPLVATLEEGDDTDPTNDAISLTELPASELYTGDFNVLIDGEAVMVAAFDVNTDGNPDWADNPPKVLDSTGGLYATWISDEGEDGMYQLADGTFVTLDEVNALITASPEEYERVPGYVQGPVEDLANVNVNTTISVAETFSMNWPTCTGDGIETNCTFTLRVTGLNDAVEAPSIPVTPVEPAPEPEPEEPAASSSDSDGTIFGCTAGKPGSPFDPVLPSMVLMALAGLWARKRRGTA